jgi:protein-disulfide isomerase
MTSETRPRRAPGSGSFSIPMPIIFIAVVAIVAAAVLILLSSTQTSSGLAIADYASIPQERADDGAFVLGNPNAPITIIEFADYACPHCQEYKPTIDQFINEYVKTGKAKFEYRIFPTAGGQTTAFFGTVAACMDAQKPGAFWMASDLFMTKAEQGDYGQNTGREIADEIGVDYTQALNCAQSDNRVTTDVNFGSALGVQGTPAVGVRFGSNSPSFISYGGRTYNQGGIPFDVLSKVVDAVQ